MNQSTRDSLQAKMNIHRAAHGEAQEADPHVRLMQSALATGDAAIMEAVHAFVDRSAPPETAALAAIAAELDADKRAPTLVHVLDVQRITRPQSTSIGELFGLYCRNGAVRAEWTHRRETFTNVAGEPICARVLIPGGFGIDAQAIEAAFHSLGSHAIESNQPAARSATAALHAAVLSRAAARAEAAKKSGK